MGWGGRTTKSKPPNFSSVCSKRTNWHILFLSTWDGTKAGVPSQPYLADRLFKMVFNVAVVVVVVVVVVV